MSQKTNRRVPIAITQVSYYHYQVPGTRYVHTWNFSEQPQLSRATYVCTRYQVCVFHVPGMKHILSHGASTWYPVQVLGIYFCMVGVVLLASILCCLQYCGQKSEILSFLQQINHGTHQSRGQDPQYRTPPRLPTGENQCSRLRERKEGYHSWSSRCV